jgi:hypothetical protein
MAKPPQKWYFENSRANIQRKSPGSTVEASSAAPALRLYLRPARPVTTDGGLWTRLYLSDLLLTAMPRLHDLLTRRRPQTAHAFGAARGLWIEFAALWLYVSLWWKPLATALTGR